MLKKLVDEKGGEVISVGKIADIYAEQGITQKLKPPVWMRCLMPPLSR